jgi:shikimate dehydrogenase
MAASAAVKEPSKKKSDARNDDAGAATLPDRYAVIGHPVAHSRSPFIHERFAQQTGQSIAYVRIDASPERFATAVREFFYAPNAQAGKALGMNVTVPHKQAALELATQLTPRAARAGAVNTLILQNDGTLSADNTDGAGLVRDLTVNQRVGVAARRVLLVGAGGAARGVLGPLLGLAPREIVIANRTAATAMQLASEFEDLGSVAGCGLDGITGSFDVVINATSAGLTGSAPPLPATCVTARTFCYDMGYAKGDTPFVSWALERGCARAVMGLGMLVEQAAESFMLWRGVRPDTASVLAALRVG